MGIWGFILLVLQYFQQFHLGIANSFNILYVHHKDNQKECNNYIGNSLMLVSYLSLVVIILYFLYVSYGVGTFEKYHADKYSVWICIIAISQYFVQFFINLFRVKNQLNRVTFCQSIIVLLNFVCIFFFKGDELIRWLVAGYVVGNLLCIGMAFTSGLIPAFDKVSISFRTQKIIIKKGVFLFLYNSCFYFIIISIRTIISGNYSVEEFGLFTFSFTLAHAIMLILEALSFIIFPKVIGKFSSKDSEEVQSTLASLRSSYIVSAHLLIYLAMPCFPLFMYLMPKYAEAITALNLIALTVLMSCNSFGYTELMMARNKEKTLSALSALALCFNITVALVFVCYLNIGFSFVILATMLTYYVFTFSVVALGLKSFTHTNMLTSFREHFPVRLLCPYITAFVISTMEIEKLIWIPLVVFCLMNYKGIIGIKNVMFKLVIKPDVVNL